MPHIVRPDRGHQLVVGDDALANQLAEQNVVAVALEGGQPLQRLGILM
jgi:hypothetical protein